MVLPREHIAQVLTSIPMFSGLDKQELGEIIRLTRSVEFQAGQTICRQHEPGDSMFIIATGRAEVQIAKEPGQFIPVAKLGPGELIGELALIDAQPRSAQVTALSKLDALQIMRIDFQKLQEKFHPATYKVTRRIALTVCARLRATNQNIVNAINPNNEEPLEELPAPRSKSFWQGLVEKVKGVQG